jgi:hypothetical protein
MMGGGRDRLEGGHVKQGRSARGPKWREKRVTERSFLDSESSKRAPCTKLSDFDLQYREIAEGLSQAHTI